MELKDFVQILGAWSNGSKPLYQQLAQAIVKAIAQGDLIAETPLPSERQLAAALAISRSTVVAAYELLQQEQWVESRQGSRTRVRRQPAQRLELLKTNKIGSNLLLARGPFYDPLFEETMPPIDMSAGTPGNLTELDPKLFALSETEMAWLLSERGYTALGWSNFRRAIAERYTQMGLSTTESQILVTSGAQQAIALLANAYLQRSDSVIIENPTYFGAIDAFRATGARLLPIQVTQAHGLRLDVFHTLLEANLPRLVYLQPNFQNPTGATLTPQQRRQVVELAAEFNVTIIEDNTLGELGIEREPLLPLAIYAKPESTPVVTIGSMSKLFWAGLRVGWLRAPEPVITRLGRLKVVQDLGSGLLNQVIASHLLPGIDNIKAARRQELYAKRDLLTTLLAKKLPEWEWQAPDGGLFLWVKLPIANGDAYIQMANRFGVTVIPGSTMSVDDSHYSYIRLPFLHSPEIIEEATARLSRAWQAYQSSEQHNQTAIKVLV